MKPVVAASVIVMGCALLVTMEDADEIGFVVAVLSAAAEMPFVPVKLNVPVPPVDCFLMMTDVSGNDTANSMPSPVVPLFPSCHPTVKVSEVMPVPTYWTEPHVEPFFVLVHSTPAMLVLRARKKETPLTRNSTSPPRRETDTDPLVAENPVRLQTVVVLFEPTAPPSRSTCRTGLSTGLLNVIVTVWEVPYGEGLTYSEGLPATEAPYGLTQ